MGQEPVQNMNRKKNNSISDKKQLTLFERDPRLVEQLLFIPELFAGAIDADIKRVERLIDSLPLHILQTQIIDGINQRFLKIQTVKQQVKAPPPKAQPQPKQKQKLQPQSIPQPKPKQQEQPNYEPFYELQTQQRFLNLLKKFQHWYYIEQELNNGIKLGKKGKKVTIRKKLLPNYQSKLDANLFTKIFLKFYIIVLKKNLASKDRQRKLIMEDFHNSIGKLICEMLEHNHLTQAKLLELSYKSVFLEKQPSKQNLKRILNKIKQQFKQIYLTKQHSLLLKPQQFENIKQISKCYLDELYLKSLKQAEDPDIIIDQGEGFGVVRNFPVLRVREDKNR